MQLSNNQQAFLALVRAGLWEKEVRLSQFGIVDFQEIYRFADEQSVIGLVAAGLDYVRDCKPSQMDALSFAGTALQLEQRNLTMNSFIAKLFATLRNVNIYSLLVKGQGIAQCYERPQWRACGDIDLYLSKENYEKAKAYMLPLAQSVETEDKKRLHLGMNIDSEIIELHGTMYTGISRRINKVLDEIHNDIFYTGNVRSWNNKGVQVFLPGVDNDVIIIFSHFINHFLSKGSV